MMFLLLHVGTVLFMGTQHELSQISCSE
jgi:hypothetical protein